MRPGDRVAIGERSTEGPAFLLVTTADGGCGWVRGRVLERDGSHRRVIAADATAVLEPARGERVTVLDRRGEGGWGLGVVPRRRPGAGGGFPVHLLADGDGPDATRSAPDDPTLVGSNGN